MKTRLQRCWAAIANYLTRFTLTQLALTLISIPILASWGLGCSVMTFVGNLVFTPILIIFLMLSSLLLFSQLLGIPNSWIAWMLDHLTAWWHVLLCKGSTSWMLSWAKPPTWLLVAIPIATILLLRWRVINTIIRRIAALSTLGLVICIGMLWYTNIVSDRNLAQQFAPNLYVIKLVGQPSVIMVDEGYFTRKKSFEKLIAYELRPWLTKQFGMVRIKELRLRKPSNGSLSAAVQICMAWDVDEVWLPYFKTPPKEIDNAQDGIATAATTIDTNEPSKPHQRSTTVKLTKAGWKAFFDLQRLTKERGIRLKRYNDFQASGPNRQTTYPGTYRHVRPDKAATATSACAPTLEPIQPY
jgi:hypothetical protein